jgi:hypothetical protein
MTRQTELHCLGAAGGAWQHIPEFPWSCPAGLNLGINWRCSCSLKGKRLVPPTVLAIEVPLTSQDRTLLRKATTTEKEGKESKKANVARKL